jgi:hypothetical protein
MRASFPLVRSLLNLEREILEEASASALSKADLKALDAILLVLALHLKRNDENLLSSLLLTDLFDTEFESAEAAAQEPATLIARANASINVAVRVLESLDG